MPLVPVVIAADHPSFAGHFPGRPIAPGVLLLDQAQRTIEGATGLTLCGLHAAKFLSPVLPGQALTLSYEASASQVRFEWLRDGQAVASGRFVVAQTSSHMSATK
jgi:3-hydroxymyristoyl/3-hydroxydecanoyl-(acyl carrier protein) dehydratase